MNKTPLEAPTLGEGLEPSPASGTVRAGITLAGRWRLLSPLGAGGMGEVWRARHATLGRVVAVKLLMARSAANRARILREAQVLANLRHDAVVEVFDVGEHEDTPFFVMGWVDGETLAQHVARAGVLEPRAAARAFVPLVDGLAAAHRSGVIHRDVKPDNVLVTRRADGTLRLVLIDFGIAQLRGDDAKLTSTGALIGTPEYMAPEVLRGKEADVRADVWGATATLHEALSGASPFRRDDFVETVRAVTEDAPASTPPGTPPGLAAVLARGLAKDPAARFGSADALRDGLADWLERTGDLAPRAIAPTDPAPPASPPPLPTASSPLPDSKPTALDALIRSRFGKA